MSHICIGTYRNCTLQCTLATNRFFRQRSRRLFDQESIILQKKLYKLLKLWFFKHFFGYVILGYWSFFNFWKRDQRIISMFQSSDVMTSSVPLAPVVELLLLFFLLLMLHRHLSSLGIRQTNSQPLKPAILLVNISVGEGVPQRYISSI